MMSTTTTATTPRWPTKRRKFRYREFKMEKARSNDRAFFNAAIVREARYLVLASYSTKPIMTWSHCVVRSRG